MLTTIIVAAVLAVLTFYMSTACNRAFVQIAAKGGAHLASGFLIVVGAMGIPLLTQKFLSDWFYPGTGVWVFVLLMVVGLIGMVYGLATAGTKLGDSTKTDKPDDGSGDGGNTNPPPPSGGSSGGDSSPGGKPDEDVDDWDKRWDEKWKDKWDLEDEEWRRKWEDPDETGNSKPSSPPEDRNPK